MKNKKIFRTLLTLCTALILMGGFSVTAYAQVPEGADDATDDSGVIYEEPEKEAPLTPDGNATLVDDFGGNKQLITVTTKGTRFLCLLRKFFLLPTTPGISDLANFRKRKTLQPQKRLQRFFSRYSILAGQWLFSLNLCDLPRRGGDYPYSRIAHIVQQSVKLPPLGILPGGLFHKELIYGYVVAQHKLKEYL